LVDKSGKQLVKHAIKETIVRASNNTLKLETRNNWWRQVKDRPFHYAIYLHQDEISLNLELLSRKPPLFINHSGHIRFGLLGSSRYYALTNLKVSGTLKINDNRFDVTGIGWMDRQWGNWDYNGIGGWNWFSIQLSNNVEILAAQIFHPLTGCPIMRLFNMIDNEGRTKVYNKFRIECLKTWRSPRTNYVFGAGWKLSLPPDTNLLISPVIEDQEIFTGFWEGCCEVRGILQGQRVNGVGYNEQNYTRAHESHLFRLISLGTAPFFYIGQLLLRREDFKVRKLFFHIFRNIRARENMQ